MVSINLFGNNSPKICHKIRLNAWRNLENNALSSLQKLLLGGGGGGFEQREGMGLLEYPAMPSFPDEAHGGVLCTFSNVSAPDRDHSGVVRQGRRHGPSITDRITPCWVTL